VRRRSDMDPMALLGIGWPQLDDQPQSEVAAD
jgi:hypothetical protein